MARSTTPGVGGRFIRDPKTGRLSKADRVVTAMPKAAEKSDNPSSTDDAGAAGKKGK